LANATIKFTANGKTYSLAVPDAIIIYDPSVTTATTTFNALANAWVTRAPATSFSGNVFLDALAFQVPTGGLPGGIKNITWSGDFFANKSNIKVTWKWAAARYSSSFAGGTIDYNALGVKPVSSSTLSAYKNTDSAGVPENQKSTYLSAATGSVKYTGSYTATAVVSNAMPLLAAGATSNSTDVSLGTVAAGVYLVSVDGLQGDLAAAEQARIDNALADWNHELGSVGVTLVDVGSDSAAATIHIHLAAAGALGGVDDGVLGDTCGSEITLVNGWNYYTGADAAEIEANQYDFQTVVAHELGHCLGLGHSTDSLSVMYPYLSTNEVRRNLSLGDMRSILSVRNGEASSLPAVFSATGIAATDGNAWASPSLLADPAGGSVVGTASAAIGSEAAADVAARDFVFGDLGTDVASRDVSGVSSGVGSGQNIHPWLERIARNDRRLATLEGDREFSWLNADGNDHQVGDDWINELDA
jgi:hypothetical protein